MRFVKPGKLTFDPVENNIIWDVEIDYQRDWRRCFAQVRIKESALANSAGEAVQDPMLD